MLKPYPDPIPGHPRGTPMMTTEALEAAVSKCDILGLPAAIHAIGDGAVRAALDAIERVSPSAMGFRIEHCQFVDKADIPRFAHLGVVASLQPGHLLADVEALRRVTPHRMDRSFPLRELIDSANGAGFSPEEMVWLGSDTPVVRPDPEDNIQAAVERRRAGAPASESIAPEQAITRDEALVCMRSPDADPGA
jgi:predicted amidohydrolase YtcJ